MHFIFNQFYPQKFKCEDLIKQAALNDLRWDTTKLYLSYFNTFSLEKQL